MLLFAFVATFSGTTVRTLYLLVSLVHFPRSDEIQINLGGFINTYSTNSLLSC